MGLYFAVRARAHERLGERATGEADRKVATALGFKFDKPAQSPLVGAWTGHYTYNGMKFTEVLTFHANGTYEIVIDMTSPFVNRRTADTGTWTVTGTSLTFTGKQLGNFVRPFVVNEDEFVVEAKELGLTVRFTRSK